MLCKSTNSISVTYFRLRVLDGCECEDDAGREGLLGGVELDLDLLSISR